MAESIISYTNKSSSIKKRVQEDETLIKEVENIEFIIVVWNHTIKATKCSLCLNTKITQIHLKNNLPSVKDRLKHHEG